MSASLAEPPREHGLVPCPHDHRASANHAKGRAIRLSNEKIDFSCEGPMPTSYRSLNELQAAASTTYCNLAGDTGRDDDWLSIEWRMAEHMLTRCAEADSVHENVASALARARVCCAVSRYREPGHGERRRLHCREIQG